MAISENRCIFIVFNYKELQIIIAMLTADKVTELFCIADDFCKFFDKMTAKYTLKSGNKRVCHRDSTMSKAEIMIISEKAVHQCTKDIGYTAYFILNSPNSRYIINYHVSSKSVY